RGPSTSSDVIRKLNKPESYIVWEERDGWLNLGNSWVKDDSSYIYFARRKTSNVGRLVVVDTDELWVYGSADWNDRIKTVKKGEAFTILDDLVVRGSNMYKCKYFYITANSQFVYVK
ncbi:N-acetylmuramoyl-L-alanine amidase, partial [Bacillus cereus]|nr:N-acetylmuramoyl-L-alanine amidase [Bacillus cereus]